MLQGMRAYYRATVLPTLYKKTATGEAKAHNGGLEDPSLLGGQELFLGARNYCRETILLQLPRNIKSQEQTKYIGLQPYLKYYISVDWLFTFFFLFNYLLLVLHKNRKRLWVQTVSKV